jgi:hypothetical protein
VTASSEVASEIREIGWRFDTLRYAQPGRGVEA